MNSIKKEIPGVYMYSVELGSNTLQVEMPLSLHPDHIHFVSGSREGIPCQYE